MLSLKRNMVLMIVAGPPNILHMSVRSTFWLVELIRFDTFPFFYCVSNLIGSYSLTLWPKPWNFRISKCIKRCQTFPLSCWEKKVIIASAIYFLHSLTYASFIISWEWNCHLILKARFSFSSKAEDFREFRVWDSEDFLYKGFQISQYFNWAFQRTDLGLLGKIN